MLEFVCHACLMMNFTKMTTVLVLLALTACWLLLLHCALVSLSQCWSPIKANLKLKVSTQSF